MVLTFEVVKVVLGIVIVFYSFYFLEISLRYNTFLENKSC